MEHPDLPGQTVTVAEEAFVGCWQARGWQRVDERPKKKPRRSAKQATKPESEAK